MRILLVRPGPSFSVQDVAFGWRDALTGHGALVGDVNYDDRLDFYASAQIDRGNGELRSAFDRTGAVRVAAKSILSDCYQFNPHVLLVVSGFFVHSDIIECIRAHGTKVVFLFTESPYEDERQLRQAEVADVCLINDPTNLDQFRSVCKDTFYVPHAYDPARHYPGPAVMNLVCDFAFVGSGFPSRVEFFEQCDLDGLDVVLGGAWVSLPDTSPLNKWLAHRKDWCMGNDETADLYRSAKTSLNFYRRDILTGDFEGGWAMGPREVELAACGTFFLRDPRPEGDELFPMLPTFTEPGEIRPLLDWWLAHPDQRHQAASLAREAIIDRTFAANAAWFLDTIGE